MRHAAGRTVNRLVAEQGLPRTRPSHQAFFNSRSRHRSDSALSLDSGQTPLAGCCRRTRNALIELWRNGVIGDDVRTYLDAK